MPTIRMYTESYLRGQTMSRAATVKKLFQYAVVQQADNSTEAVIVVEPRFVLARDVQEVNVIAARAIPADKADKLSLMEIVVRGFERGC